MLPQPFPALLSPQRGFSCAGQAQLQTFSRQTGKSLQCHIKDRESIEVTGTGAVGSKQGWVSPAQAWVMVPVATSPAWGLHPIPRRTPAPRWAQHSALSGTSLLL